MLPPEVIEFLQGGLIMFLATRGADHSPESVLATAARVSADGRRLTVFVPEVLAATSRANVRDNGHAALTLSRVTDHRSMQIKGRMHGERPALEEEHRALEPTLERFAAEMGLVGMPRSATARLVTWPSWALELRITELYEQTPGPRAGEPLGTRGAA